MLRHCSHVFLLIYSLFHVAVSAVHLFFLLPIFLIFNFIADTRYTVGHFWHVLFPPWTTTTTTRTTRTWLSLCLKVGKG